MEKFNLPLSNEINLSGLKWEVDKPKANLMLVHGAGEHIGRYDHWAKLFNDQQLHPSYDAFSSECLLAVNLMFY